MNRAWLTVFLLVSAGTARADSIKFQHWAEMQPLLALLGEKATSDFGEKEWDNWIRTRDFNIRERAEHETEDAISALLLFGTTFTQIPPVASPREAVNAAGELSAASRSRVNGFIEGLDNLDTERFQMILENLRRRHMPLDELRGFLLGIVRRFAIEQRDQPNAPSLESSFPINFAVEEVLRSIKGKPGTPARIRRAAVVGPGLDFAGEAGCSDIYPPQSIQPFAVMDSLLRLQWAQPAEIQIAALDFNQFALAILRTIRSHATLEIRQKISAAWTPAAVAYWQRFGDSIAVPATGTPAPSGFHIRTIVVKPQFASRIKADDMDVVAQFQDQTYDLMVATNVLQAYDRADQILALGNMSRMLAPGGLLIATGVPSTLKTPELEVLGETHVTYTDRGAGADMVVYRRK